MVRETGILKLATDMGDAKIEELRGQLADAKQVLDTVHELLQTTHEEKGYKALLEIEAWQRRNLA